MILEQVLSTIKPVQARFEHALNQKIQNIKFAYSKDINDKQIAFLKRDEELCKAAEDLVNALLTQQKFLLKEIEEQKHMMGALAGEADKAQENYMNVCIEFNEYRFKHMRTTGTLRVDLAKGRAA